MRIKLWDRFLIALSGLLIAFIAVGIFVFSIGVFPFKLDTSILNGPFELWQRVVMVASSLLLLALGIHGVWLLLKHKDEKGFIIQHTEFGDMSISMNAMESMVKKCVDAHQALTVNSTRIHRGREGIVVDIKITLQSGINIPLMVNALQKQIKQYITSCSGVDVQAVRVMVETSVAKCETIKTADSSDEISVCTTPKSSTDVQVTVEESVQKVHESIVRRMFKHSEEPTSFVATEVPKVAISEPEVAAHLVASSTAHEQAEQIVVSDASDPFSSNSEDDTKKEEEND